MKIDVVSTVEAVDENEIKNKTTIVIDVLRATSTIVTALNNGCKGIIPIVTVEEAFDKAQQLAEGSFLLGGERKGVRIEGFSLGNSPLEYEKEIVENKVIIFSTSNGTRAIRKAEKAKRVFIASFLNISAVAKKAVSCQDDITIICAGTAGKFSLDDIGCAGMLVHKIVEEIGVYQVSDLAYIAYYLYQQHKNNILDLMKMANHYNYLNKLGLEKDLNYCLKTDRFQSVPIWSKGQIILD